MPEPPELLCRVEVRDDAVHLIAAGELHSRSREVFDHTVQAVLTGHPAILVLDLTAVTFLSLEGVAAVVDAAYRAVNAGSTLVIRPSRQVARRLHSVGLAHLVTATETTAEQTPGNEAASLEPATHGPECSP